MMRVTRTRAGQWIAPLAAATLLTMPEATAAQGWPSWLGRAAEVPVVSPSPSSRTFGTTSTTALVIGATEFDPINDGVTWSYGLPASKTASDTLLAWVRLPAGAVVTSVELEGCDSDPAGSVQFVMGQTRSPGGPFKPLTLPGGTSNAATPGCGFFSALPDPTVNPIVIDNVTNTYQVILSTTGTAAVTAVRVYYTLQVSPAPGTATFGDVPTSHPFFRFVEALVDSGITAGCGGGNYCPDEAVTRGQMAVFLSKALGLQFAP
jgi:hypothetical protein